LAQDAAIVIGICYPFLTVNILYRLLDGVT